MNKRNDYSKGNLQIALKKCFQYSLHLACPLMALVQLLCYTDISNHKLMAIQDQLLWKNLCIKLSMGVFYCLWIQLYEPNTISLKIDIVLFKILKKECIFYCLNVY